MPIGFPDHGHRISTTTVPVLDRAHPRKTRTTVGPSTGDLASSHPDKDVSDPGPDRAPIQTILSVAIPVEPPEADHRPVRPPPSMSCDHPPRNAISTSSNGAARGNLRELQAPIETRAGNFDAITHRQHARDLRLAPQLYSGLVSGIAPGADPPIPPLDGGEGDTSGDLPSSQG